MLAQEPLVNPPFVSIEDAARAIAAQASADASQTTGDQRQGVPLPDPRRACDGCPPRRLGSAFLQTTVVNVIYWSGNMIPGKELAQVTPATWWNNMQRGWNWDLDDFSINQFGHPYQGNSYFTTGRANGLNFWESSALTAFGSGTWEYFGETGQASFNDFINTTLGGIALGEMFHRAAWLVRDTRATGKPRRMREIAAMVIDPMTGFNRFASGDANRVVDKPPEMVPTALSSVTSVGALWRDSTADGVLSTVDPLIEVTLLYGDLEKGVSRTPFDAFAVRLDFGGGNFISEARVRGRLFGQPFQKGGVQLNVAQGYQYLKNSAYQFGAQSVELHAGLSRQLTSRFSFWANGWGGLTILGAVDSLPLGGVPVTESPPSSSEDGHSTEPRFYDYGPGTNFGGFIDVRRDGRTFFTFAYDAHHIYVLDGVRANHLLQRLRADLMVPIRGRLGIAAAGEFFDRQTFYQDPLNSRARYHYPQFRLSLTWGS
ncbi:MAG TPA: DUF3943 domain-containing protein [Vicinamibacterales bacterium]|nr:DUF3943 domain-containing protein [Vicinamibacterales bacterium]